MSKARGDAVKDAIEQALNVRVLSSASDMKKFMEEKCWKDVYAQLGVMLAVAHNKYTTCKTIEEFCNVQGIIEGLKTAMHIPEQILLGLQELEKKQAKAEEEVSDES